MAQSQQQQQLPREIWMEILCRCSNRSMIQSKLVCREWRDLIESPEFARFFVTPLHIVAFTRPPETPLIKIHQLTDDFNNVNSIVRSGLSDSVILPMPCSSVNGLILLLRLLLPREQQLWLYNPITREYLTIPNPPHSIGKYYFGFGVSSRSNEYKVVWTSGRSEWHVFTLGSTRWRTLSAGAGPTFSDSGHSWRTKSAFLAGNVYWLDREDESRIWCFDLETEVFTILSVPPPQSQSHTRSLGVLKECLCLCDLWLSLDREIIIEVWLLKGGDWSKEYVIKGGIVGNGFGVPRVFPVRVLRDGSVLFRERSSPAIYHFINGVKRLLYPAIDVGHPKAAVFTPNFLPLKTLLKDMTMKEEEIQLL